MFQFNSTNGTTLLTNISGCVGLSLYSSDILVITTYIAVYLFNLTNNVKTCAIGCDNSTLFNGGRNAVIDSDGSFIITDLNQVISYPIYHECLEGNNLIYT
jgi:hypothetical protein